MARKVIGPEILDQRYDYMKGKSVWYYIDLINSGLRTNTVDPDGIILVKIKYNINMDLINNILEFYYNAGWDDIDVTLTGNADSLYGETIFKFHPPESELLKVRKKANKLL